MNYKIEKAIKKSKKYWTAFSILWLALTIVFVLPLAVTIVESTVNGKFILDEFILHISGNITAIGSNLGKMFKAPYFSMFISILWKYTVVFFILMAIGIKKLKPKSEYTDIEHGSSGWAQHGEQYKVLSNKEGIILAEENYLPVDKRGNVNVLIVGRIRCR